MRHLQADIPQTLLSASAMVRRITPPGRRRVRRGGLCPGTGRRARAGTWRGGAAASPARRRGGAEPGAQQRPDPFHSVDVHLEEAVAVLVAGVLAPGVAHGLVPVPPFVQPGVDVVLV